MSAQDVIGVERARANGAVMTGAIDKLGLGYDVLHASNPRLVYGA